MTNAMIIFNRRVQLMDEGIIGTTGRYATVLDKDGNETKIAEPEMIHTYAGWKAIGRQVKKGEKAVAMDYIWKHTIKKAKEEEAEDETKMFMTKAYFFTMAQTEKIEK